MRKNTNCTTKQCQNHQTDYERHVFHSFKVKKDFSFEESDNDTTVANGAFYHVIMKEYDTIKNSNGRIKKAVNFCKVTSPPRSGESDAEETTQFCRASLDVK